jgi:GxxExxY protein
MSSNDCGEHPLDEPPRRHDAKGIEPTATEDVVARQIVDAAFMVHRTLGPGLLESVYEECLACELGLNGLVVERQVNMPVFYRNIRVDAGFRMDMVVNRLLVVEVKATERLLPVHEAQLLTYLKLSGYRLGFLINFNVPRLKEGLRRFLLSAPSWRRGVVAVPSLGPSREEQSDEP